MIQLERYKSFLYELSGLSVESQLICNQLLVDLEHLSNSQTSKQFDPINLLPSDLIDLPPAVIAQLALTESDNYELDLVRLIDSVGGIISLDKLIILLFREKGEIVDRTQLNARLNRMMRKGVLFSYPKRKGVYSTKELSDEKTDAG